MRTYKNVPSAKRIVTDDDFVAENCGTVVDGLARDVSQMLY